MAEAVWKRPGADDDEEELLRQQEEFLRTKQQASVRLINLRDPAASGDAPNARRARFSSLRQSGAKRDVVSTSRGSGEVINPAVADKIRETTRGKLEDTVQNIPTASPNVILGNIVERKFDIEKHEFNNCVPAAVELGFPEVFESDDASLVEKIDNKQSLFWRKVSELKSTRDDLMKVQRDGSSHCNKEEAIVMQDKMVVEVHNENLEKLAKMSEAEILEEKRKLEETLDPKIIQFLRNKKKKLVKRSTEQDSKRCNISIASKTTATDAEVSSDKKMKLSSNDDSGMDCQNDIASTLIAKEIIDTEMYNDRKTKFPLDDTKMDCENDALSLPESSKEIFERGKQQGWLHMNNPEPEKLKWMENLPENKKDESTPNEEYNARFDFNGLLLPYKDENLTVDKGLHHHGEEPERPGYSLQELLQLSRSSTQQQRCTALTTLANIMENTRKGWYDKALHPAPLVALSQKNILLLLRFSLDDPSVAVVTAALQAFRAFLVSEADEICLDKLYGFDGYMEPALTPQLEDKDTSSLKDHELAQLDTVAALLRSDFLLRIRYILNEMHPPPVGVTCALEILIRLARHSHITALNISSTPYLLDTIVENFIPLSIDQLAMQDTIKNIYGIPVVKAIKLCRVLVTYGKKPVAQKLDSNFKIIQAILTYINSETGNNDINLSIESLRLWRMLLHYEIGLDSITSAQLILISQLQLLLSNHDIQNTSELACEYAAALIAVACHEKTLKSNISTLLAKWSTQFSSVSNPTWGVMKLITESLSAVDEISIFKTTWLSNQHIFSTLRSTSNLLSDYNVATDREPSCLPNLNVLTENGELQPIVSVHSCIPFLATVLNAFYNNSSITKIRAILEHPSFCKYIRDLETTEWSLERSWYSRTELYLLTAVVKAASLLEDTINNRIAQIVWKITVKLISALPADTTDHVRELLQIALSHEKVNLGIIANKLAKLDLASTVDQVKIGLYSNAASLYERYITSNGDWNQAAMPKDWLFLPLVHIYTKCKNDIRLQSEDKDSILIVLSLALVLPDLTEKLSPTLRFSRLLLVYLCDTVYLDDDVSTLLLDVLSKLLRRYYAQLDFQTELPGLSSFTDLFTALCEHFCSSSYGDDGFAMTLLVPLAQRHDPHYRKLLWSEHAAALRYLKLPPEKLVLPLKEYLYPEEEDTSLIESYITALVRGVARKTWCPVPFMIAIHHSAMYLKRSNRLAVRMREQVEKLRNKDIADALLHYIPPRL